MTTTKAVRMLTMLGLCAGLAVPEEAWAQRTVGPELPGQPVAHRIEITGGGPVTQALPGRNPYLSTALAQVRNAPAPVRQQVRQMGRMGPFSNNVVPIGGEFRATLVDRGPSGDQASGTATFTTRDGTQWRVVIKDAKPAEHPSDPMHTHWGGVATFQPLHGASGHHTPLVPTTNAIAMWGTADVYRNGELAKQSAPVHVMLTTDTRGDDFRYQCYQCQDRPMRQLHMLLAPGQGVEPYQAPGGFLHVMWEDSRFDLQPIATGGMQAQR